MDSASGATYTSSLTFVTVIIRRTLPHCEEQVKCLLFRLVGDECSPIRKREVRPMAPREWGLEPAPLPVLALAIRDRARCDRRTVRGTRGWFRARNRCRRR